VDKDIKVSSVYIYMGNRITLAQVSNQRKLIRFLRQYDVDVDQTGIRGHGYQACYEGRKTTLPSGDYTFPKTVIKQVLHGLGVRYNQKNDDLIKLE